MPIYKCKYCKKEYEEVEPAEKCEEMHERVSVGSKDLNLSRFKIEAHLLEGEYLFARDVPEDPTKYKKGPVVYKRLCFLEDWDDDDVAKKHFEELDRKYGYHVEI